MITKKKQQQLELKETFRSNCLRTLEISNGFVQFECWLQLNPQRGGSILKGPLAISSVIECYVQKLRIPGSPF